MVSVVKKFLFLLALFFTVTQLIDFRSPEFDPLRAQWQTSFDHIAEHQFYGEYVQPVHEKVGPIVTNLQDEYVVPTVSKVSSVCLAQYQAYLSKYVSLLHEKLTESPVHAVWSDHKPKLDQLCQVIGSHLATVKTSATTYTAVGLIKFNLILKYAVAEVDLFFRGLISKSVTFYAELKPQAYAFYHDTLVPCACSFGKNVQSHLCDGSTTVKQYIVIAKTQSQAFYGANVYPALEQHVFSHVRVYYQQYAKQYVDAACIHASKYYTLFKINQALDLSKQLLSGTYEQAAQYLKQEEEKSAESTVIEATTGEEEDLPTETVYDSMGTPEVLITADEISDVESETVMETASETESEAETETKVESTEDSRETVDVVQQSVVTENELEKREDDEVVLSLAQEIQTWKKYILESVENIFVSFDSSIAEMEDIMISDFKPQLTKMLQQLSETAHSDFAVINKVIYNINSTSVVLENGQEVEIDEAGNIIDHKVTREEMRAILAGNSDKLKAIADGINTKLQGFVSDVEVAIDDEKKLIVDIYEEFAEVAINEFSKKMMYSTFSSSFDNFQNKKDDESFKDWKEYVKVKNTLIKKREDLISKKPHLSGINTLLVEVRETLRALDHETGSYYAILRAQANLAFQAREKEERLAAEAAENGTEEEFEDDIAPARTVKSFVIKTQTLNGDGTFKTDEAEIPTVEDEEISDVESEDEDFDAPEESSEPVTIVDIPEAHTVVFTPPGQSDEPEHTQTAVVDVPEATTVTFTPPGESDTPVTVVDVPEAHTVTFTPPESDTVVVDIPVAVTVEFTPPAEPTPEVVVEDVIEHVDDSEIQEEEETLEDVVEHNEDA